LPFFSPVDLHHFLDFPSGFNLLQRLSFLRFRKINYQQKHSPLLKKDCKCRKDLVAPKKYFNFFSFFKETSGNRIVYGLSEFQGFYFLVHYLKLQE